jgi:hypothetical protein
LWLRGGFPPSFLARGEAASLDWRRDFLPPGACSGFRLTPMGLQGTGNRVDGHFRGEHPVWNRSVVFNPALHSMLNLSSPPTFDEIILGDG